MNGQYDAENLDWLSREVEELQAWGRQIHDALDGRVLPPCPAQAPARIAALVAEVKAMREQLHVSFEDGWGWKPRAEQAEAEVEALQATVRTNEWQASFQRLKRFYWTRRVT